MLSELKKLSERDGVEPESLRALASLLLDRQFIYSDKDLKHYQLAMFHSGYFESIFDALNRDFILDMELGMVGIVPRDRASSINLKKDETLFLLLLRLIYEDAITNFSIENGCACSDTEVLLAKFYASTRSERSLLLTDVRRTLTMFRRMGLIDIQEDSDKKIDFRIRPAIRIVLNEGWLKSLEQYMGAAEADDDTDEDQDELEESL